MTATHRCGCLIKTAGVVKVKTRDAEYEWKVAGDGNAQRLADEIKLAADG